mmetsp:Transcript_23326/g.78988  ORF Transcript_23326/g.78988 Transcript_23326/m.78988 type:complete len:205 (-) Transcript_23326:1295-1909(-)
MICSVKVARSVGGIGSISSVACVRRCTVPNVSRIGCMCRLRRVSRWLWRIHRRLRHGRRRRRVLVGRRRRGRVVRGARGRHVRGRAAGRGALAERGAGEVGLAGLPRAALGDACRAPCLAHVREHDDHDLVLGQGQVDEAVLVVDAVGVGRALGRDTPASPGDDDARGPERSIVVVEALPVSVAGDDQVDAICQRQPRKEVLAP